MKRGAPSPTNKKKQELPSSVKYLNEDVDRMTFETHIRNMIRELLEPVIVKSKNDREMIFKLQKKEETSYSRLDFLEKAVYKKDPTTGGTLFDQIEEKVIEMDIRIKSEIANFKEQVSLTETNLMDEIFKQNQRITKMENYGKLIEINKQSTETCQLQMERAITRIRGENDEEKRKLNIELDLMSDKINQNALMCSKLPPQMDMCQSSVLTIEEKCKNLTEKIDETIVRSVDISTSKWSKDDQEKFLKQLNEHLGTIENSIDKNQNHCDSLQNWMDVYLPMRLQHQISETIKECLPRKGKFILGVVDQQMMTQLRERMFADINYPDLKKRCLDVIEKLKLESDTLIEENIKAINEAQDNWLILEAQEQQKLIDQRMKEQQEQKNEMMADVDNILPTADQKVGGGDADSEALGKLQEQLERYTNEKCDSLDRKFYKDFDKFQTTTLYQLEQLNASINSMNSQNTSFINALKDEVEQYSTSQRKQNIDTLSLIKNISHTLRKMKEHQIFYQDDLSKIRQTLTISVEQLQHVSNLINIFQEDNAGSFDNKQSLQFDRQASLIPQIQQSLQKQLSVRLNATQAHKGDDHAGGKLNRQKLIGQANENMKKLQISVFRTNFKKDKTNIRLKDNLPPFNSNPLSDLIEEDEKEMETIGTDKRRRSVVVMKDQETSKPSVGPASTFDVVSPRLHLEANLPQLDNLLNDHESKSDLVDAVNLIDMNRKLNEKMAKQGRYTVHKETIGFMSVSPQGPIIDKNLLSQKKTHTFRNDHSLLQSDLKKKFNRMSIQAQETDFGTNFDFSALGHSQRYTKNKRGSMPENAPAVLTGANRNLNKSQQANFATGWKKDKTQQISGSSSGQMNQSFGFGPLQVQRAKYSSQEKMVQKKPTSINADFSFDQYGNEPQILPKIN